MEYAVGSYKNKKIKQSAFTIVELLVVIVIIGILATVTIIGYVGISNRAKAATLKSDLSNSVHQFKLFQATSPNNDYPTALNCSNPTSTEICLRSSGSNIYSFYTVNNLTDPKSFILDATNGSMTYRITEGGGPFEVVMAAPTVPVVAVNTILDDTTYSWNTPSCPNGTTDRYQYNYTISPDNYSSGWVETDNNSISFTTNVVGKTYAIAIQAKCYSVSISSSEWSASGTGSYTKNNQWKSVVAGSNETCAISITDQAYCWGTYSASGFENHLGYGYVTLPTSYIGSNVPIAINNSGVLSGKTIKKIAISGGNGCVIASDDKVYCWGFGTCGQLGVANSVQDSGYCVFGPNQPNPVPMLQGDIPAGMTIKDISMGREHSCVVAFNNYPYCMGQRYMSAVNGSFSSGPSTVPIASYVYNTTSLSAGGEHTCTIISGGSTYCWGYFANWPDHYWTTDEPSRLVNISGAKAISSGYTHSCGINSSNLVYCWGGDNTYGQFGDNTNTSSRSTVDSPRAVYTSGVLSGKTIKSISAGYYHTCAIASDDKAYCWGRNDSGQLGNNSTVNSNVPVSVDMNGALAGKTIKSISAGNSHTCVIASNDAIYCWGGNGSGQLGIGNTTQSLVPVIISSF